VPFLRGGSNKFKHSGRSHGEIFFHFKELFMKPVENQNEKKFNVVKLEERIAPTILLTNPGGNHPQGDANGKALDYENPSGHAPPGWNK
jgi:hypothetical protein